MLHSQFGWKFRFGCFKKALQSIWAGKNKYYTLLVLVALPVEIYAGYLEDQTPQDLTAIYERKGTYTIYGYVTKILKIFFVRLVTAAIFDLATLQIFFAALKQSLCDYCTLSWNKFHSNTIGELMNNQYEKGESISTLFYAFFVSIVASTVQISMSIYTISKKTTNQLGMGLLAGSIFHVVVFFSLLNTFNTLQNAHFTAKNKTRSLVENESSNFNIVKTYNMEDKSVQRLQNAWNDRKTKKNKLHVFKLYNKLIYKAFEITSTTLLYSLYYRNIVGGNPEPYSIQIVTLYESVRSILAAFSEFSEFMYIFCLLEHNLIEEKKEKDQSVKTFEKLECVSLGYDKILQNITFCVENGQKIALVGPNGSGKTLLLRILSGLIEGEGVININGIDLKSIKRDDLYKIITFVSQYEAYTEGTVMENLRYGNDLTESEVVEKCKYFGVNKVFAELENGYNKISQTHGTELSGGQRQRVSFMRGVLRKTPVLILDDCLNSVNTRDKKMLQERLLDLNDRTVIMTCDNLEILCRFDKILILRKDGVKFGTYEDFHGGLFD